MLYISIKGLQLKDSPFKVIVHLQPEAYACDPHHDIQSHDIYHSDIDYNDHVHHEFLQTSAMDKFTEPCHGDIISTKKPSIFSKAYAQGSGIGSAQLNQLAEFFINDAEGEVINVDMINRTYNDNLDNANSNENPAILIFLVPSSFHKC